MIKPFVTEDVLDEAYVSNITTLCRTPIMRQFPSFDHKPNAWRWTEARKEAFLRHMKPYNGRRINEFAILRVDENDNFIKRKDPEMVPYKDLCKTGNVFLWDDTLAVVMSFGARINDFGPVEGECRPIWARAYVANMDEDMIIAIKIQLELIR